MNENLPKSFPWELSTVSHLEMNTRDTAIAAFPGTRDGFDLTRLAKMMGTGGLRLRLDGFRSRREEEIEVDRARREGIVAVALVASSDGDATRLVLGIPGQFARKLVDVTLGREPGNGVGALTSGEEGALLYAINRAGGDLIRSGAPSFVVRGILYDANQVEDYLGTKSYLECKGRIEGDSLEGPLFLWLVAKKFKRPGSSQFCKLASNALGWPVSLRFEVGETQLRLYDIQNLERGDLVVLDRLSHPTASTPGAVANLVSGTWRRPCEFEGAQSLKIISWEGSAWMKTQSSKSENVTATLEVGAKTDAGSMEVAVHVELGTLNMEVGQAANLVEGKVLRLDREIDTQVSLCVGNQTIAIGELKNLDGEMAVEITEVL